MSYYRKRRATENVKRPNLNIQKWDVVIAKDELPNPYWVSSSKTPKNVTLVDTASQTDAVGEPPREVVARSDNCIQTDDNKLELVVKNQMKEPDLNLRTVQLVFDKLLSSYNKSQTSKPSSLESTSKADILEMKVSVTPRKDKGKLGVKSMRSSSISSFDLSSDSIEKSTKL